MNELTINGFSAVSENEMMDVNGGFIDWALFGAAVLTGFLIALAKDLSDDK